MGWERTARARLPSAAGAVVFVQEARAPLLTWPEASSQPALLRSFPEGCFSRDLLSKWHLDSGLGASWGGTPCPSPLGSGLFPPDTRIWPEPGSASSQPL